MEPVATSLHSGDLYGVERPFGPSILVLGDASHSNREEIGGHRTARSDRDVGLTRAACLFAGGPQSSAWRREFWRTAAFADYGGPRVQFCQGQQQPKVKSDCGHAGFQNLLDQLRPQFVLVLGKNLWRTAFQPYEYAYDAVSIGADAKPFCLLGSSFVFGINHPAALSFAYVHWSGWVKAALEKAAEIRPFDIGCVSREKPAPPKSASILVADDSEDKRRLVQVHLQGSPYQLTFEENGRAAVTRFASTAFDLILMDVRMPLMDGLAATRAIRELERRSADPPVPIIALTGNASLQDVEMSRDAGCNAHMCCPISKLDLLRAIERCRWQ